MPTHIEKELAALSFLAKDPRIIRTLQALGAEAKLHLVGGTVRDTLLGIPEYDLDLASCLVPQTIIERLEAAEIRCIPTGLKHQTVTAVPVRGGPGIEITTFRGPNMSPEGGISQAESIEEDLKYRDFTINALAFDLETETLIDPCNGISDLQRKLLKAVGSPEHRFSEDPLRVLRMIRFSCRKDFSVEQQTLLAAQSYVAQLKQVSIERIREEFSQIMISDKPDQGLRMLAELGILKHLLPEIACFIGFEQNRFHFLDLFEHTLLVVQSASAELVLRLAALFHDVGKPSTLSVDDQGERHFYRHESVGAEMCKEILSRFRYSKAEIDQVANLVQTHMRPLSAGSGGLRRLIRDTEGQFSRWRELKEVDARAAKINVQNLEADLEQFDQRIEEVRKGPDVSPLKSLAINGDDLISLGLEPGPAFGEILRGLHERVLDNPELNTREALLEMVSQIHKEVQSQS